MPRGRPRKNPLPTQATQATQATQLTIDSDIDSDSELEPQQYIPKNSYICSRCHAVVSYYPEHINMTRLTHVAPWHREMPEDIQICRKCCEELSNLIESWYLEPDMGKTKWQEKYKDI